MKRIFSLLLTVILLLGLVACSGNTPEQNTESKDASTVSSEVSSQTDTSTDTSEEQKEWEPLKIVENKVLVSDYETKRIIVYDLDLVGEDGDLDKAEIWSLENAYSASVKYREDTVFGDVILHTADYNASIVDYETKKTIWASKGDAGWGVHSIEILPSGNVVTAGATDGIVRLFNSANCINKGDKTKYTDYDGLPGAHGVLWDPEYDCLWALGTYELVAYQVMDNGDGTQSLKKISGMGGKLPNGDHGGHDLAADLLDSRYLWVTSNKVFRFDKEEGTFTTNYKDSAKLNKNGVKGFGNNLNNNYIYTQSKYDDASWAKNGNEGWTTDTITFGYWKTQNFLYLKKCVSEGAQFYKARVFYGKYQ